MRLLLQPKGSNLCGQTSMAMIFGITLDAAIELYGSRASTRTKQHVEVLRGHGYVVPTERLYRFLNFEDLPDLCMLHAHRMKRPGWLHWMVWHRHRVFDPLGNTTESIQRGNPIYVTSYLPIRRKSEGEIQ